MGILSIFTGGMSTVYRYLAMAGAVLALCVGSYFYGNHVGKEVSKVAIAEYTAKHDQEITDLLGIQTITNTKIVTKVVTKIQKIHDQGVTNEKIATNNVPDHGLLSNGWVYLHDVAATGNDADTTRAADGAPSTTTANRALAVIVNNYGTCRQTEERLIGLQSWINETNANIAKANKDARTNHR